MENWWRSCAITARRPSASWSANRATRANPGGQSPTPISPILGLASKSWTVTQMSKDTLHWTWSAFVVAVITGTLLFVSKAHIYAREPWFLAKLVLIAAAGLNMGVFHVFAWRRVSEWDARASAPLIGAIAGGLSLTLWVTAIFCGRFIGFTLGKYE